MENERLLHAYLNGTASKDDLDRLNALPEYAAYIKIAEAAKNFDVPNFDEQAALKAIQEKLKNQPKIRTLVGWKKALQVAAVICLLFAGYLYIKPKNTELLTHIAEKQHFTLPDGSEVALNAESYIEYTKSKWEKHRELELKGEAYFKVTKGKRFTVNTPTGVVSVLGTEFNIFAREDLLNVFCYEGMVSVAFQDTLVKLPGGTGIKLIDGKLVAKSSESQRTPAWIYNESRFTNTALSFVLEELERQYPVSVVVPESMLSKQFSVTFPHDNLELAIQLICAPLSLTYTIENDQITLHAKTDK